MPAGAWRCMSIRDRDEPFVEDLGRRTKKWSIEAFVVGDDYADVRDRLIEACDMPGAGELGGHPNLGSLQVACTGCGLTERTREGRMARLSLEFVEAGANQYPTSRVNTEDNVTSSARTTPCRSIFPSSSESLACNGYAMRKIRARGNSVARQPCCHAALRCGRLPVDEIRKRRWCRAQMAVHEYPGRS